MERTPVLEIDNSTEVSVNFGAETNSKQWDRDDLTPLVRANANEMVMWQGAEVTLSEAISGYLTVNSVTEETQDVVIALVLDLLANPVVKNEEAAEEEQLVEEEPAKTEEAVQTNIKSEEPAEQKNSDKAESESSPKKETDAAKLLGQTPPRPEKSSEPIIEVIAARPVQSETEQTVQEAAKAETTASLTGSSANTISANGTAAPEAMAAARGPDGSPARESAKNETSQEFVPAPAAAVQSNEAKSEIVLETGSKQQVSAGETSEPDSAENLVIEMRPEQGVRIIPDQEAESTLPAAIEEAFEPVFTDQSDSGFEDLVISFDPEEPEGEEFTAAGDEPALAGVGYKIDAERFDGFTEEDIMRADLSENSTLMPYEASEFSEVPVLETAEGSLETGEEILISHPDIARIEISEPEQLARISVTVEETESTLIQLAERIDASGPEVTEDVNEILDNIIGVPARLKADAGEIITTEAEAQAELEELFTELLDRLGIDYTPELIEALARLTLEWDLADDVQKLKKQEEADMAPQGRGTHEIIRKLLAGISFIKKAIARAGAIGKSALQLYSFSFAV